MKKNCHSVEQITAVLKQAESGASPSATSVAKSGSPSRRSTCWKKAYGGMLPSEARELKQLREENAPVCPPRGRSDRNLDKVMLQDIVQK